MAAPTIPYIDNEDDFEELIKSGKPVVVQFTAGFCGACKMVNPGFVRFAKKCGVPCYKVDIQKLEDVMDEQNISTLPTFKVFHGGDALVSLPGTKWNKIEEKLTACLASVGASGGGGEAGGGSGETKIESKEDKEDSKKRSVSEVEGADDGTAKAMRAEDGSRTAPSGPRTIQIQLDLIRERVAKFKDSKSGSLTTGPGWSTGKSGDVPRLGKADLHSDMRAERDASGASLLQPEHCSLVQNWKNAAVPVLDADRIKSLYQFRVPKLSADGGCSVGGLAEEPFLLYKEVYGFDDPSKAGKAWVARQWRLEQIVRHLAVALDAEWAGVYRAVPHEGGTALVKEAYVGRASRPYFPLTEAFAASSNNSTVAMQRKAVIVHDTHDMGETPYYVCDGDVRTEICAPIVSSTTGKTLGIIDVEAWRPKHFTDMGIDLVLNACQDLADAAMLLGSEADCCKLGHEASL